MSAIFIQWLFHEMHPVKKNFINSLNALNGISIGAIHLVPI